MQDPGAPQAAEVSAALPEVAGGGLLTKVSRPAVAGPAPVGTACRIDFQDC
jgi:hypothetical protein